MTPADKLPSDPAPLSSGSDGSELSARIGYNQAVRRAIFPPLIAMLTLAGLLLWQVLALLSAARAVNHSDTVIRQTNQTLKLILDMQTGERGYLLASDDPAFLEPYTAAKKQVGPSLDTLMRLVGDDPRQVARISTVRADFTQWQKDAEREIRNGAGGRGSSISRQTLAVGKLRFDAVRQQFAAILNAEEGLRRDRAGAAEIAATRTLVGGSLITLLVGGLLGITTRRQLRGLAAQYERALDAEQTARNRLGATLYSIGDAVLVTDARGRVTRINPVAESLTGWAEEEARGKSAAVVFDIVNETTRQRSESPVDRVLRGGKTVGLPSSDRTALLRRDGTEVPIDDSAAPVRDSAGRIAGVVLVFRDVSERRKAEEALEGALRRETLANTVGAAIRDSPLDSAAILQTAVTALGQAIGADRCYYGTYDQERGEARLLPEWHRDGLPPIAGDYPMARFSINRDPAYRAGGIQIVEDVREFLSPGDSATEPSPLEALGLRALIRVPIQVGNAMTVLAVAASGGPRRWTPNEVRVVETVASQLQSALEAARLLAAERARAEREYIVARIGEAVLAAAEPDAVRRLALSAIGEALGADRTYFADIDPSRDSVIFAEGWVTPSRDDLNSIGGQHRLSEFAVDITSLFQGGTLAIEDVRAAAGRHDGWTEQTAGKVADEMRIRSILNVPFFNGEGRLSAVLGITMADSPRAWTAGEIDLVESIAAQTRAAVEAVRIRERERNIAQQLQAALTPVPPDTAPGLELASFYRPALEEAGVGGDFLDIVSLKENRTALVVADLAGKGLAAAAQVATIRNMLRAVLYSTGDASTKDTSVRGVVTRLNDMLAENSLLAGFATLFVGVFDPQNRELTYVSCGQEPGLVWRASDGLTEELPATGAVLGAFPGAKFEEKQISLFDSDLIALFTDGLTEAGPTRRNMLNTAGVAQLLSEAAAERGATTNSIVSQLVRGVDTYAQEGVRDDVCLLLARIE
ncbi:MAG: SpoIIE family protein phosphatase [Cytophagales bacterium]|nr:SpoIIE family protein phosphatase [Armatimonadota bacterium]